MGYCALASPAEDTSSHTFKKGNLLPALTSVMEALREPPFDHNNSLLPLRSEWVTFILLVPWLCPTNPLKDWLEVKEGSQSVYASHLLYIDHTLGTHLFGQFFVCYANSTKGKELSE